MINKYILFYVLSRHVIITALMVSSFVSLHTTAVTIYDKDQSHNTSDDSFNVTNVSLPVGISWINATMRRINVNDSVCSNWTNDDLTVESYNVNIFEYQDGNITNTSGGQQDDNHLNMITLQLPPISSGLLCQNTTMMTMDQWNRTMDDDEGNECDGNSTYYREAFWLRPTMSPNGTVISPYCSLSTILANIHHMNDHRMVSSTSKNKTRTIILAKEWVHHDDMEQIMFHNVELLRDIQLVFLSDVDFLQLDKEMLPTYQDNMDSNVTFGFITATHDNRLIKTSSTQQQAAPDTTMFTVIMLALLGLVFGVVTMAFCSSNGKVNIAARTMNASSSITSDADLVVVEKSMEERKRDFEALPKMRYRHESCTYHQRKLMKQIPEQRKIVSLRSVLIINSDNTDQNDQSSQNGKTTSSTTANDCNVPMIQDDIEQIPQNTLEMIAPPIDPCNNENVQQDHVGETGNVKDDDPLSSMHTMMNVGSNDNSVVIKVACDSDEDTHDSDEFYEECPICCEEYKEDEIVIILPQCRHIYHVPCLGQWFIQKKSEMCPLCKTPIIINDVEAATT